MYLQRKVLILPFAYNFFLLYFQHFLYIYVSLAPHWPALGTVPTEVATQLGTDRACQGWEGAGLEPGSASYFGALLLSPSPCFFLISKGILLSTLLYYSTFHFFVFYIIITFSSFKFHVFMLLSDSLSFSQNLFLFFSIRPISSLIILKTTILIQDIN
jgi:hypothetical protein